jgi:hypothetical protein
MAKFEKRAGFDEALSNFVAKAQVKTNEHFAASYPNLNPDRLVVQPSAPNARYARVHRFTDNQEFIWAFVERTTGDIFKPASFNAPAKYARGNIFSDTNGLEALSPTVSIRYHETPSILAK